MTWEAALSRRAAVSKQTMSGPVELFEPTTTKTPTLSAKISMPDGVTDLQ